MPLNLRPIVVDDLPALLELNQRFVPMVGGLDADRMRWLFDAASWTCTTPDLDGFMIVLPPGIAYGSPNYRWIDARWTDYAYVDRIAVDDTVQRRGLGRAMYERLFADCAAAGIGRVTCEVNVRPSNPRSLAFHERLGFTRSGVRSDGPEGVTVAILSRRVAPATPRESGASEAS